MGNFGRDSVHPQWRVRVNEKAQQQQAPRKQIPATSSVEPRASLANPDWISHLDRLREATKARARFDKRVVASAALATSTISYGYVTWLLRGGLLLSGLLSTLPAWHGLDPLPVLAGGNRKRKSGRHEGDRVEQLFADSKLAAARTTQPEPAVPLRRARLRRRLLSPFT